VRDRNSISIESKKSERLIAEENLHAQFEVMLIKEVGEAFDEEGNESLPMKTERIVTHTHQSNDLKIIERKLPRTRSEVMNAKFPSNGGYKVLY
jgi:hypothetical protein